MNFRIVVEPTRIFELIRAHGVTHMCGAPIVYNVLINAPDAPKGKGATPVVGLIAGAAPPVAVLEGAENIGIKLTHVYGLTEVYGPASVCAEQPGWDDLPAAERAQLKRRQGVPYPLEEAVTVIDPETMRQVLRDGETIVHANAHHMATAVENTEGAIARIKAAGSDVTSIKRL